MAALLRRIADTNQSVREEDERGDVTPAAARMRWTARTVRWRNGSNGPNARPEPTYKALRAEVVAADIDAGDLVVAVERVGQRDAALVAEPNVAELQPRALAWGVGGSSVVQKGLIRCHGLERIGSAGTAQPGIVSGRSDRQDFEVDASRDMAGASMQRSGRGAAGRGLRVLCPFW